LKKYPPQIDSTMTIYSYGRSGGKIFAQRFIKNLRGIDGIVSRSQCSRLPRRQDLSNSYSSSSVCKNLEFGVYSRKAFQKEFRDKQTPYFTFLAKQNKKKFPKSEEKPWPKSVRIAGYTALVLGVPYLIGTLIAEISSLQEFVQRFTSGRKLMDQIIRPYWGHVDAHPYVDDDKEVGTSLETEPLSTVRKAQDEIQSLCGDQTNYNVQLLHTSKNDIQHNSTQKQELTLAGSTLVLSQSVKTKLDQNNDITVLGLEFLDQQDSNPNHSDDINDSTLVVGTAADSLTMDNDKNNIAPISVGEYYLRTMTTVWSAWHYFSTPDTNVNSSNETATKSTTDELYPTYDEADMERLEMEYKMQQIQTEYNDPNSTRHRDDLIQEMEQCKKELRQYQKRARWSRVKSWLSP